MPAKTSKTQRRNARLQAENTCLKAVIVALYDALDAQARGYGAAAFDAGIAEGTQDALAVDQELRDLLENEG